MAAILLCFLINVLYFQFWNILLLVINVLQSKNFDFLGYWIKKMIKKNLNGGSKMAAILIF